MRKGLFVAAVWLAAAFVAAPAMAQEAPYEGKRASIEELIDEGTFDRSPLKLPFKETSQRAVTSDFGRLDFEHHYEATFNDVVALFDASFKGNKPLAILDPKASPVGDTQVAVVGTSQSGDSTIFTVTTNRSKKHFNVEIKPVAGGTIVVVQNMVITDLHSGMVPDRVGFKPVDAPVVNLRWN